MTWSDERVTQLRQLWDAGLSASQIASIMGGLTRNAIIGKAHRLGLAKRVAAREACLDLEPLAPRMNIVRRLKRAQPKPKAPPKPRRNFASLWGNFPQGEPEPFVPRAADVVSRQISIMALTSTTCRWPDDERNDEGQITFCGHPVKDEHPYCAAHCALAYIPRRERTEKQKANDANLRRLRSRLRSARALPANKWLVEEAL
jgi:GcrA cell cycle regulator